MSDYLKRYHMKIHALSPIFIGSGQSIGKKEYIYDFNKNMVYIPDLTKMFAFLQKKHLENKYMEYMLKDRQGLNAWLKEQNIRYNDYKDWILYRLDAGDTMLNSRDKQRAPKEILEFVKDAYGMPYIPGSSIKGMIRTALLAYEINHSSKFSNDKKNVMYASGKKASRTSCLNFETTSMEVKAFHTLEKTDKKQNAVNSNMSGLIVSDSAPIDITSLTLGQKIDLTLDGVEKPLPILREVLKPGTDIYFDITIDEQVCPYSIEQILKALDEFNWLCVKHFYNRFGRGTSKEGTVWFGGGAGFASKTVLYQMYGDDAVKVIDNIMKNTLGKIYDKHKHSKDRYLGISPHVCKCTRYQGRLYDMGKGRIEVI